MKRKDTLKFLSIFIVLLLSFACEGELEDCYETVCDGPDNTNCRQEPVFNSGCFPPPDNGVDLQDDSVN
ncbi:MAG: hypothetical protein AB8B59_17635 [Maribacter sp.]